MLKRSQNASREINIVNLSKMEMRMNIYSSRDMEKRRYIFNKTTKLLKFERKRATRDVLTAPTKKPGRSYGRTGLYRGREGVRLKKTSRPLDRKP